MTVQAIDLKPRIGTEIKTDKATLLSGKDAAQIRDLLDKRGVLVFHGIGFTDDEQLAFARTIGVVNEEGEKGIYTVSFDKTVNSTADYLHGTVSWHIDRPDTDVPPRGSMLSPRVLSPTGGETEFANTYAAYDDLSESEKSHLDTLKVIHAIEQSYREAIPNPTEAQRESWRRFPPKVHPLVWGHRSGRKSLLLSTSGYRVVGMDPKESDALLRRLMAWASQPQYVYQHRWTMGDLVIWDNTGCMHRVTPFDKACGRRLHRVTLVGEEPIAAA